MISEELDERMLVIRGKGLLYGFILMSILIVLKNLATSLFGVQLESTVKTDFTIIYLSMFVVVIYMLINNGISEQYIVRTRFIFPILSILFVSITILEFLDSSVNSPFSYISNVFNLLMLTAVTVVYSCILLKKYAQLKEFGDRDEI